MERGVRMGKSKHGRGKKCDQIKTTSLIEWSNNYHGEMEFFFSIENILWGWNFLFFSITIPFSVNEPFNLICFFFVLF